MKRIFVCVVLLTVIILSACTSSKVMQDTSIDTHSDTASDSVVLPENAELVEEDEYYKLYRSNFNFYYYIYDENHNIAKFDGPINREPHIEMADEYLVRFTLQTGTGLETQWGYYYDVKAGRFSETFYCIYDQSDGKVLYQGELGKVTVRDIFDDSKYHKAFSSFENPLADNVVNAICDAKFVNEGKSISVTYYTGSDYEVVTDVIELSDLES